VDSESQVAARVAHAHKVEGILHFLGWLVAVLGLIGICAFGVMWATGDLNAEQAVSLILGAALGSILSGATAYGSGVNIGLGAERLEIAASSARTGIDDRGPDRNGRQRSVLNGRE
jgi:hypothetical protein